MRYTNIITSKINHINNRKKKEESSIKNRRKSLWDVFQEVYNLFVFF